MKKLSILLVILLSLVVRSFGQDSEDYKVYDAVVRHMFRDGVTRFDMNAKVEQIVLRERTHSSYAWGTKKENWEQVKFRLPNLTDETIADYEAIRTSESSLEPKFDTKFKYVFVSDKKLEEIFKDKNERANDPWADFYKNYPGSAGYNSFSRVGYDKAKRNALVYFVNWCGSLCGTGSYVHLQKGENGWAVKNAGGMWIS